MTILVPSIGWSIPKTPVSIQYLGVLTSSSGGDINFGAAGSKLIVLAISTYGRTTGVAISNVTIAGTSSPFDSHKSSSSGEAAYVVTSQLVTSLGGNQNISLTWSVSPGSTGRVAVYSLSPNAKIIGSANGTGSASVTSSSLGCVIAMMACARNGSAVWTGVTTSYSYNASNPGRSMSAAVNASPPDGTTGVSYSNSSPAALMVLSYGP